MAVGTCHTGTGGAGGVGGADVVHGCNREGACVARIGMLKMGKRKRVEMLRNEVKHYSRVQNVKLVKH